MTHPCIAIIEDEPLHALLLEYNLKRLGYQIKQYDSGRAFLEEGSQEFQLIIINVQLDEVNGLQICEDIRRKGVSIPILFLSTSIEADICACIENIDFLKKPFKVKDLINKVNRMINNSTGQDI
jgi:DNA-binding response OmpR family regulator